MKSLGEIAAMIEAGWTRLPASIRRDLDALTGLGTIADEASYARLADIRRALHGWRGKMARDVKALVETHLTLYRVEKWEETARPAPSGCIARPEPQGGR